MPELDYAEWEKWSANFPQAHLLQTAQWGELKSEFGWKAVRLVDEGDEISLGAQLLFRRLPLGFTLAYLPKGPLSGYGIDIAECSNFWNQVDQLCKRHKAVFLKVEPDIWEDEYSPSRLTGFRLSGQNIQPQRTLIVDLTGDEEQILARMKQKTRYNIRLAQKKGIQVHSSPDLDTFYRLLKTTGERDQFGIHSLDYYRRAYELFNPRQECELFVAEYAGDPLAAIMAFSHGSRAWYLYGASSDLHRELMAPYLLQWEAMRWARRRGCTSYDLYGVPDVDEKELEANFTVRSDGLWGVYRFKRGFGGELRRAIQPWDRVYQPQMYAFYRYWFNRAGGGLG